MTFGSRITERREQLRWTQLQVGGALKVPRELVSMWENDVRMPNLRQLSDLAALFDTSASFLLTGKNESAEDAQPRLLLRGCDSDSPETKRALDLWLTFLNDWADLRESPIGRAVPPKKIDRGPDFSDIRSASKLALEVRDCFDLGLFALPDLYAFLDENNILVCQAKLGSIGDGNQGISGVFLNHPRVGFSILTNGETSRGRQMFTLAHEFAHALFHYGAIDCIVSRYGERSAREQFADAFAAHFLVPGKGLQQILHEFTRSPLDEYDVLYLAHYFNVSYAFMLNRLDFEGHITSDQKRKWQTYSPRSLARHVGLDPELFRSRADEELYFNKYPVSVLNRVRELIEQDELSIGQAADLLRLDPFSIQHEWLQAPAGADDNDLREFKELAETYASSKH